MIGNTISGISDQLRDIYSICGCYCLSFLVYICRNIRVFPFQVKFELVVVGISMSVNNRESYQKLSLQNKSPARVQNNIIQTDNMNR